MTIEIPESVTAEGRVNYFVLPAGADLAGLTTAEFTAGVDVTCFMPAQVDIFTTEQAKGESTRACMTEAMEVLGKIKRGIADLTYTVMPQGADADPGNEVKAIMDQGTSCVIAVRRGPLASVPIAAGDKYHAIRATVGAVTPQTSGSDEFAPITDTVSFGVTSGLVEGTVVA